MTKTVIADYTDIMSTQSGYLLIVEDDNDIRQLLNTALTYAGYRVRVAPNGKEGLEAVQKERPAIVITDIMMPQLDGFGLVHRLRINPDTRDIPVVFITATYVTDEDQEFALNIGATRFLQKPVDLEQFLGTVSEVLKQNLPTEFEPLEEIDFYEGYRKRLEAKLEEKNKQIAREEYLLGTPSDENNLSMQTSIHHAVREREEIEHLLDQLLKQIEKFEKPK
ncbi:MAG: response regulator [Anaerolineales bacterium]|nr:response regulator [Anaerolineales bacterium]